MTELDQNIKKAEKLAADSEKNCFLYYCSPKFSHSLTKIENLPLVAEISPAGLFVKETALLSYLYLKFNPIQRIKRYKVVYNEITIKESYSLSFARRFLRANHEKLTGIRLKLSAILINKEFESGLKIVKSI